MILKIVKISVKVRLSGFLASHEVSADFEKKNFQIDDICTDENLPIEKLMEEVKPILMEM